MTVRVPKTKQSVAYLSRGTFRAFETLMQRAMRDKGLQIAHFDMLRVLWEGDGISQSTLAELAFITESSTAQVINEMVRLKLIERRIDPSDKRKRNIYLLPAAVEIKDEILTMTAGFLKRAVVGISQGELDTYKFVAEKLRQNVMAEYERRYNWKET